MKLPFVGQSYSLRSLTAAAQTCINLYAELIQDPNEVSQTQGMYSTATGKNKAFLYGCPGRHVFKDLTTIDAAATPVRGVYTGAGRCFVAAGTKYMELDSSGNLVGSVHTISNATVYGFANSPVQFFPNGNQLFFVSGGVPYVDSGSGPVVVSQSDSTGTVNGFGYGVSWVSGDYFVSDGSWNGKTIVINGSNYTITPTDPVGGAPPANPLTEIFVTTTISPLSPPSYTYSVAGSQFPYTGVTGSFLDNSFWFSQPYSRAVKFSNVNNGSDWNGLDFITKDSWPDDVLSILVNGTQIFLFGTEGFECWTANPGSSTDFFARIDGATNRIGSVSPWGPIVIQGNVFFLGRSSQGEMCAYVLNGFTPVRISQHGQEETWKANNLGQNAISYTYTEEGHSFWVINFGAQTWAWDTTTGGWHQRMCGTSSSWTPYGTAYHSYIPEFGSGKHLTGGPLNGTIYESSASFYDDAGSDIYWQKSLPFQYNQRMRLYDSRLELEMETGTVPSGAAPVITLDYSDDRGHTFGTADASQNAGTNTAYSWRVFWTALGSYYERVYRLTGNGKYRVALIDLDLEQEQGSL